MAATKRNSVGEVGAPGLALIFEYLVYFVVSNVKFNHEIHQILENKEHEEFAHGAQALKVCITEGFSVVTQLPTRE